MPEGKGQESGDGKAFKEIMAKIFPVWGEKKNPTNLQIQEAEWIPKKIKINEINSKMYHT